MWILVMGILLINVYCKVTVVSMSTRYITHGNTAFEEQAEMEVLSL